MNWGPAIVISFGILMGVLFSNSRITDLRVYFDKRFDAVDRRFDEMERRFDQRFADIDHRLDDLKDFIKSEVRRLEDRLERLEHAIFKP